MKIIKRDDQPNNYGTTPMYKTTKIGFVFGDYDIWLFSLITQVNYSQQRFKVEQTNAQLIWKHIESLTKQVQKLIDKEDDRTT